MSEEGLALGERPEYLKEGEEARLIPAGAATQREKFACSVLMASLHVVQPFARAFFGDIGWRVGNWAEVKGYTEPVFKRQPDGLVCRPDGLLILHTGRRERRLLVETKIGSAKIDPFQIAQYAQLARVNDVEAILTVSNELSTDPTLSPYRIPPEIRGLPIFHWSWPSLVSRAELVLVEEEESFDREQEYILREIIRYFDHETAGVSLNMHMCSDWANIVEQIQGHAPLSSKDPCVLNVVQCWHQQLASICISKTRELKLPVTLDLPNSHWDQQVRLEDDVAEFVDSHQLWATFKFATQARPIALVADAVRRNVTCSLSLDAPLDRQTYRSRVRWLLNQLPEDLPRDARIDVFWDRNQRSSAWLSEFQEDLDAARIDSPSGPRGFEIVYVADLANRFAGTRSFVPALADALTEFYEHIAQYIRAWQPRASSDTAREQTDVRDDVAAATRRHIKKSGEIDGRTFSIFDDGSIEVETGRGIQRFNSFAELSAAARNGQTRPGSPSL